MAYKNLVYISDLDCPVIPYWENRLYLIASSQAAASCEYSDRFDKTLILLDKYSAEHVSSWFLEQNIATIIKQKSGAALFVTAPDHHAKLSKTLKALGQTEVSILPPKFRSSPDEIESIFIEDQFKHALGYPLPHQPLSNPVFEGKRIPFVNNVGDLVIPAQCDPIWQWWKAGISPKFTVQYFTGLVDKDILLKLLDNYRSKL